jgi:hypothetical protein
MKNEEIYGLTPFSFDVPIPFGAGRVAVLSVPDSKAQPA